MAQKKNKERKQNLVNYKNKIRKQMSEQKSNIPNIRQYPVWSSTETIEVSGLEWEQIYNLLNIFRQAIVAGESVMQRNLEKGKVTMKYVDEQGAEVSQEQVAEYTKQLQEFFAKRAEEEKAAESKKEQTPVILDSLGSPATSETSEELPASPGENVNPLKAV